MKATGIIRRVDDLGRVVIPKEIRRTMKIREGDPLEIFVTEDGGVEFLPYRACLANEVKDMAERVRDALDCCDSSQVNWICSQLYGIAHKIKDIENAND